MEELIKLKNGKPNAYLKILRTIFKNEIRNTIGNKNISFNEFQNNITEYSQKPYVQKMIEFYKNDKFIKKTEEDKLQRIFSLYYGSINIFKPSVAYSICMKYKPTTVLDFCAGWASRMIGCTASGSNYIGIDNNVNLKEGYNKIIEELNIKNATMIYENCMNIDYSKYKYDLILTSPMYYNTEVYSHMEKRSKKAWDIFYQTIFTKVFEHLQKNGHMIINVNHTIYERNLLPLFGEPIEKIEYPKSYRRNQKHNPEFIYIWKKNNIDL